MRQPRAPEPAAIEPPALYAGAEAHAPAAPQEERVFASQVSEVEVRLTGPLADAPAVRALRGLPPVGLMASAPTPPAEIPTAGAHQRPELFDIEVHTTIEVTNIAGARRRIAEAVMAVNGRTVNEVVEDDESSRGASLSLRIPSDRVHAFLTGFGGVGRVRAQRVVTRELGRAVNDAQILLENLTRELARYQALLEKASTVEEMLKLEAELNRVRTSIERTRGDLDWLRDRAAYSTVYVTLLLSDEGQPEEQVAKLHPGLLGTLLVDLPPAGSPRTFAGGGFSLLWSRNFGLELALMKRVDGASRSTSDATLLTAGGELYSDFLGGGRRRWLNPYFGFRGGYARLLGADAFAFGSTLGVELYKTRFFLLELETRGYALLGLSGGVHAAVEPLVGVSFAY